MGDDETKSVASALAKEAVKVAQDLATSTAATNTKMTEAINATSQSVALLGERLGFVQTTLDEVKTLLANKYVTTDCFAPVAAASKDHEARTRRLEKWVFIGLGGVTMLELILRFLIKE
jgi:hypothetical protein